MRCSGEIRKGTPVLSPGMCQHLYSHRGQAEGYGFAKSFQTGLLQSSCSLYNATASDAANAAGVLAPARLREASSDLHVYVCALLLCCWAYGNVVFAQMDLLGGPKLPETLGSISEVSCCLI